MKKRAVVIFSTNQEILVVKRKKNNLNYYCFPGGTVEENESFEKAAKREILEELGHVIQSELKFLTEIRKEDFQEISQYFSVFLQDKFLPELSKDAPEFEKLNADYVFEPIWINKQEIKNINLFPVEIKDFVLKSFL